MPEVFSAMPPAALAFAAIVLRPAAALLAADSPVMPSFRPASKGMMVCSTPMGIVLMA
jgi:hypothetical protein